MQLIPLSHCDVYALVDDADYAFLSQWRWQRNNKGYAVRRVILDGKPVYLNLHRVLMQAQHGQYVDHIDNNRLNNTRANLRLCTQSQNQANRRLHKNNTTGFKGVTRRGERYHARLWVQGQMIHLGYHETAFDASLAYDQAARLVFGEYARLNHPELTPSPA